jgi:curved DNA-binding protein CbpA
MTDYFALLGFPRRPWIDPEVLKNRFHQLAAQHHPDVAGGSASFQQINEAYRVLRDSSSRLRHLLALEEMGEPAKVAQLPPSLTERFMEVATFEREIHTFLKQQGTADSAIQKSLLAAERFAMQRDVEKLAAELEGDRERLAQLLQVEDHLWSQRNTDTAYRLAGLQQEFAFVGKWIDQLRERSLQLASAE